MCVCARRIGSKRRGEKKQKKRPLEGCQPPYTHVPRIPACYVRSPHVLKIVLLLLLLSRGCPRWRGPRERGCRKDVCRGDPGTTLGVTSLQDGGGRKKNRYKRRRFSHEPKARSPPPVCAPWLLLLGVRRLSLSPLPPPPGPVSFVRLFNPA